MVSGVLSSCDAAEKKAMRWRSRSRSRSISPRRDSFALSSSCSAVESRCAIWSRLRPSLPISSRRFSPHSQWKSSSAIFPAMALMRTMGRVMYRE